MAQARLINGICGGTAVSDIDKVCKAVCDNMYFESQDSQAASKAILRSIQGTSVYCEMPEKVCRGIFRCSRGHGGFPALYACFGKHVYLILDGDTPSVTMIGQVSTATSEPVRFCETGGYGDAHPHLIVVDGAGVFAVDMTLLPLQQRANWFSVDLPLRNGTTDQLIKPTHCAFLYNYLVVNDAETDAFYLSYQYPFESILNAGGEEYINDIFQIHKAFVDPQDESTERVGYGFAVYSEWMTDNTTALISTGSNLWTFGPRSYQVFSYMNDENYPFQSADTAAAAIGIRAPKSLATIGDMVFWLAASDIGQNGVYMGKGKEIRRVSTYDLEREFASMVNPEDAVAQCWQENHHIFYALTFLADGRTYVYDVAENMWHTRSSYDQTRPDNMGVWRPQFATFAYNKIIFGTRDDNKLIYLDSQRFKEYDDLVIVRTRTSGVILNDFSPFYISYLRLVCNNGQVNDPNLIPQVAMRYSWDGSIWSDQVIGLVGEQGQYFYNTEWWNLECGKIFSVEFKCSDDFNFCILTSKITYDPTSIY